MIEIKVTGQKTIKTRFTEIVSGAINYRTIKFAFNEDWDELTKIVQFTNGEVTHEILMESDTVSIPAEVLTTAGYLSVKVRGVLLDDDGEVVETRITTNPQILKVTVNGVIDMNEAQPVTPSMYDQLTGIATQARADAEQAKTDAALTAPLRDETLGYRNEAEGYADTAEEYEEYARQARVDAETAAGVAGQYAEEALNNKLNGIEAHDISVASHPSIIQDIRSVEAIARGRATAHVFDTKADMDAWLLVPENIATLVVGDNLYIRDIGVKDYWWDGTSAQELEAEAPDLTDYYTKNEVEARLPIAIEESDYAALINGTPTATLDNTSGGKVTIFAPTEVTQVVAVKGAAEADTEASYSDGTLTIILGTDAGAKASAEITSALKIEAKEPHSIVYAAVQVLINEGIDRPLMIDHYPGIIYNIRLGTDANGEPAYFKNTASDIANALNNYTHFNYLFIATAILPSGIFSTEMPAVELTGGADPALTATATDVKAAVDLLPEFTTVVKKSGIMVEATEEFVTKEVIAGRIYYVVPDGALG